MATVIIDGFQNKLMKVAVLLAGYEGQKFIYEQIFSLIDQSEAYVEIFVRVDGTSTTFKETIKLIMISMSTLFQIIYRLSHI